MNGPFVLGVDLDGVVSDFVADVRVHAAEWLGEPLAYLDENPDYHFSQWGINEAPGGYPALHKFAVEKRGLFINATPMRGAPQALRNLSAQGIRIRIITARICVKGAHAEIVKQTVDWLENHGIPYWDICFVNDKTAVEADLYIDDSPTNIYKLQEAGKQVLVYKTSVNQGVGGSLGGDNWPEIERLVMQYVNEKRAKNGEIE